MDFPKTLLVIEMILFTSTFWGHLHKLLGTKLKMSSDYHPQTDGTMGKQNSYTDVEAVHQCQANRLGCEASGNQVCN